MPVGLWFCLFHPKTSITTNFLFEYQMIRPLNFTFYLIFCLLLSCGRATVPDKNESSQASNEKEENTSETSTSISSLGDWVLSKTSETIYTLSNETLSSEINGSLTWESNGKAFFFVSSFTKGSSVMNLVSGDVLFGAGNTDSSLIIYELENRAEIFLFSPSCAQTDLNLVGFSANTASPTSFYEKNMFDLTASNTSLTINKQSSLSDITFSSSSIIISDSCESGYYNNSDASFSILNENGFGYGLSGDEIFIYSSQTKAEDNNFSGKVYGLAIFNDGTSYPAEFLGSTGGTNILDAELSSFDSSSNSTDSNFLVNMSFDTSTPVEGENFFYSSQDGDTFTDSLCSFSKLSNISGDGVESNSYVILCNINTLDSTKNDQSDNQNGIFVGFVNP